MKKTIRGNVKGLPYCLHDCHFNRIKIHPIDDCFSNVTIFFREGYYSEKEDAKVPGKLFFPKADLDFCNVYLMRVKNGKIKGKAYSLQEFCTKYRNVDMEIIDETYGYNSTKFSGNIYEKKGMREFMIEIYHFGDMIYLTEEEAANK